ncbi:TPA: hypothetical protein ACMDT9_003560 [Vibrio parahaemolyticus]
MDIVTTEVLPVETSMSGKNSCYLYCPSLNRRTNYGVCLFTINAFNKEKLNDSSDCFSLIGRGLCEALKYQKKEQEAGRALFYKAREIKVVNLDSPTEKKMPSVVTTPSKPESPSYMRGWNQVEERERAKSKSPVAPRKSASVAKKKSAVFGVSTPSLSDAVDEAVKSHKKSKPKTPPSLKGMSILERARLMASK